MNVKGIVLSLLLTVALLSTSSTAFAADWPNTTQWKSAADYSLTGESTSGESDFNMKIALEEGFSSKNNRVHKVMTTSFNAYIYGNTSSNGGTFDIAFNRESGANLNGSTFSVSSDNGGAKSTASDVSISLPVPYGCNPAICYDADRNQTIYRITAVVSEQPAQEDTYGYHFRVSSVSVNQFGFIGGVQLPFAGVVPGRGTYQDLEFKMDSTERCGMPGRDGTFTLYDSDNRIGKNIQNGFKWRETVPSAAENLARNGSIGAGWTNWEGEYNALKMRLLDVTNAVVNPNAWSPKNNALPHPADYWDVDGSGYQIPVNTDSETDMSLTYSVAADSQYTLQMTPLGIANYVALGFPFNESSGRPCMPWTIEADSTHNGSDIIYKDSGNVTFSHYLKNANTSKRATDEAVTAKRYVNDVAVDTFTLASGTAIGGWTGWKPFTFTPSSTGEHCEYISYTPVSNSSAGPLTTAKSCVYVIDPVPTATDGVIYEKNATAVDPAIQFAVNMGGGYCPPAGSGTITVTLKWTLNLPTVASDTATGTWGNGACAAIPATVDNLTAGQAAELNSSDPGKQYSYTAEVVGYGVPDSGNVTVIEVPYARFYGNDIYATTAAGIRFNDSFNTDSSYDGRGSVSQYAAISFGTVYIDTAAFRNINPGIPTQPPKGLDSPDSQISGDLKAVNSASVYSEVIGDLPVCTTVIAGTVLPNAVNGCYKIQDDTSFTPNTPRLGGGGVLTYNKKITLVNQEASKPLIIDRNIENTTGVNSADPANSGVLLIVSAGNIYIDHNVQRIDAILVAAGEIYTCGYSIVPNYGVYANDKLHQDCRKSLTINGAVSAKKIHFQRAVGSRLLAPSTDASGNATCSAWLGIRNCNARGNASDGVDNLSGGAAEIINFPAYLYFANPYLQDNGGTGAESDAMFQAPPRL